MSKIYRLGLDIGIASVGWSIIENDPVTEEPVRIIKMGVRTFKPNEVSDTGESTAKDRREKRSLRRRTRRRALRMKSARELLEKHLGITVAEALAKTCNEDVFLLRARALDERILDEELCKVILNIFKRRGFKSNRKNATDKESGLLLSAISENEQFLKEKGYRTLGEAFFKDEKFKKIIKCHDGDRVVYNIRNHDGGYGNCVSREMLLNEIRLILQTQKELGNEKISDELIEKISSLFERQRNFDDGPGAPSPYSSSFEIGDCTFIKTEKRAPKATFTFEYFTALSKINSLRIDDEELSLEEKKILYKLLLSKKQILFKDVRKALSVPTDAKFNLCRYVPDKKADLTEEEIVLKSEKSAFVKMENSYEIRSKLGLDINVETVEIIDEVATILTLYKSDERIDKQIEESDRLKAITNEQKDKIKSINVKQVGSLSIKAMRAIIPYLLEGYRYDEACKLAGFNHSSFSYAKKKFISGEEVKERIRDITSPVVKRAVNQTIRIINEIVRKYGSPQFVTIELARDLSRDFIERRRVKGRQQENFERNEKVREQLAENFGVISPSNQDVLKYKLYLEQDGKCMYSGTPIDLSRLFEQGYVEVDHILPYSRSMNDSYNNKVLVLARENQNKRNSTPYEYMGGDEKRWASFVSRVSLLQNAEKRRFLLKKNFGEAQQKEFISRNLNDTRYVSRFVYSLIKDFLEMTPSTKYKNTVRSVNGAVTSYLRKFWGINKIREDGDIHHAIDATVIATATDGMVRKITRYNNMREKFIYRGDGTYVNKSTGEIMTKEEKQAYEDEGIDVYSKYLPKPYEQFVEELKIRSGAKYFEDKFTLEEKLALSKIGYEDDEIDSVKPIFVSKMKCVKPTGAIHKETLMSTREYAETKRLVTTVTLDALKLDEKRPEKIILQGDEYPEISISNYYRPQDDRLLYLKLKKHIKEQGRYEKGATEFKPKKDGTDGPIVKKVKVYELSSSCVITPNGGAANDRMYRVDVFKKEGKFYLCPVYIADVYAKKLPNKVIEIGKAWREIDDTFEFLFSLYQNDLIRITSKKEIILSKAQINAKSKKVETISSREIVGYYKGTGIATASVKVVTHDGCYLVQNLGVKTLLNIEKLHVDIMGNVFNALKEERSRL